MNKQELLNRYSKDEDKLLVAKVLDKVQFSKSKNKIEHTDFLDMYQRKICESILKSIGEKNYIFYGGFGDSDKNMLIIYPKKLEDIFKENKFDYNQIMRAIEITLPNELIGKYEHRDYLSGLMKLGIKREKCGDIVVTKDGAYIVISEELSNYIPDKLEELTRFSKSKINLINIEDLKVPERKTQIKRITVPALRLDSVVAELANTSRVIANEIIEDKRVFINYENEDRKSKILKENDIIVIRGKGKFEISKIEGNTKRGKISVIVKHFI